MSGSGNTTAPSSTDDLAFHVPLVRFAHVLVLVWSRFEPRRVGEVAILDPEIASSWLLGRGPDSPTDSATRLHLGRQTPTGLVDGGIEVRRLGKVVVSIGGQALTENAVGRMAPRRTAIQCERMRA